MIAAAVAGRAPKARADVVHGVLLRLRDNAAVSEAGRKVPSSAAVAVR